MNLLNLLALPQSGAETFWFPSQASTGASRVDDLFYFIFYVSLFAFIAIVVATIIFSLKYSRSRVGMEPEDSPHHSTKIEIVWSVIPALFMVAMFWYGFKDFVDSKNPPVDAYQIEAVSQKWSWTFNYPNGAITTGGNPAIDEGEGLVIPVNKPVVVRLESTDVLHSFFVPAFRAKMDAVPGRYTYVWFEANEIGEFPLYCAEYCGSKHSRMLATVKVVSQEDFDTWAADAIDDSDLSPEERGKKLFAVKGCIACHSTAGVAGIGPALDGLYGKQETLVDGTKVAVDDNYIRESLLDPQAKVVEGYANVPMTSFAGQLDDDEISAIIAYLKSLN
ncbi:MAG: cytochrome c oxidase subunit II [Planctomycetota bacterium]|jgi:cytochrome c oxidase subunit 2|nr:cytochrome c oxidase subunit II [Planctomycetota bacterium]